MSDKEYPNPSIVGEKLKEIGETAESALTGLAAQGRSVFTTKR